MGTIATVCIVSFIFGILAGVVFGLFMAAIGKNNQIHDYYQDGFADGYKKGIEDR